MLFDGRQLATRRQVSRYRAAAAITEEPDSGGLFHCCCDPLADTPPEGSDAAAVEVLRAG